MIFKKYTLIALACLLYCVPANAERNRSQAISERMFCEKAVEYAATCYGVSDPKKQCFFREVSPKISRFIEKGLGFDKRSPKGKETIHKFQSACLQGCRAAKKGIKISQKKALCSMLKIPMVK